MTSVRTPTGNATFAVGDILYVRGVGADGQPTVVARIGPADEKINGPPDPTRLARLWGRVQHWFGRLQGPGTAQPEKGDDRE